MSAKPRFKPRKGWANRRDDLWEASHYQEHPFNIPVRVTDARDLTAEQAVERVLQELRGNFFFRNAGQAEFELIAKAAGMTARVVNGKVRVRRVGP